MDSLYMDIAERVALMSHGRRLKVGSVITKNDNIISYGWNGMPPGMNNDCEHENPDGSLTTRSEVMHSESNAISKLAAKGGTGADGATIYTVHSPCFECAKLIKQAGITRLVYRHAYRITDGIDFLRTRGVQVNQLEKP
jgi:dCMP deaminase